MRTLFAVVVVVFIEWIGGCAVSKEAKVHSAATGISATGEEIVAPTPADIAMVKRVRAEAVEIGKLLYAREVVLALKVQENATSLDQLEGKTPASEQQLEQGRLIANATLKNFELARHWHEPEPYVIHRALHPITIDGQLDEEEWRGAVVRPIDVPFGDAQPLPNNNADFRMLWDDHYIYIGYTVRDTNIVAPVMPRDAPVYNYDCVEAFFLPEPRTGVYWELNMSPTGSIYDALMCKYRDKIFSYGRIDENIEGLKVGCRIDGTANQEGDTDKGYTIEVAVPIDQLPGTRHGLRAGDHLRCFVGWVNRQSVAATVGPNFFGYAPILGGFHNIFGYGDFVLGTNAVPLRP